MRFAIKGHWEYDISCWLTAKGKEIALLQSENGKSAVRFFDARDGKELRTVSAPHMFSTPWIAPRGDAIAYQGPNGIGLGVIDMPTRKQLYSLPNGKFIQAALSRDCKMLVVADSAGKVHVHDLEARKELFAFDHPEKERPSRWWFQAIGNHSISAAITADFSAGI